MFRPGVAVAVKGDALNQQPAAGGWMALNTKKRKSGSIRR
jgi:hypothetical protein